MTDGYALYTPGLSENRGGTSAYYSNDLLGNLWTLDGSSKSQLYYQDTPGFGTNTATSGAPLTPFGHGGGNGCQTDADTGLILMGHRYYDTRIGRFISQDPAGDGDNWYAYAGNSPTNETDPDGLTPEDGPGSSPVGSPGYSDGAVTGSARAFNDFETSYTITHTWIQDHERIDGVPTWVDRPGSDTWTISADPAGVPDSSLTSPGGPAELGSLEQDGVTVGKQGNPMKDAAREALKKLHATEEQLAAANRAISWATASSKIAIKQDVNNIIVNVTRDGRNGYQVFENVIDQSGTKQVIQKAYDELGNLVHFDPK